MLASGEKVLVVHRRLFERDDNRYFIGIVDDYEAGIVKVTGYSFVRDRSSGKMLRKDDVRTKLLSVASGTLLVYQLPSETAVERARFIEVDSEPALSDGGALQMNLAEVPHSGHL